MISVLAQEPGSGNALGAVFFIVSLLVALALLVLFIAAVVSILRTPTLSGGGKALWVVIVFVFQFFGPVAWFWFGRRMRLDAPLGRQPGR